MVTANPHATMMDAGDCFLDVGCLRRIMIDAGLAQVIVEDSRS